jgi:hypothetical protein
VHLPFDNGPELLARRIYALIKCGRDYRLPYEESGWHAIFSRGEYPEDFEPFLGRFLTALSAGSWPPGSYFPGGWYRMLKARGEDVLRVAITPQAMGPFYGDEVRIDTAGQWTVGRKVITGSVLHFFLRHLHFDADVGRYVIRYDLETHVETRYVHHESLPFRVLALEARPDGSWLSVNDGTQELLRWDTLRMDADEQLYCAFRPERLPAQFADGPRFRLLDALEEHDGRWIARSGGTEHVLTLDAPWPGAGSLVPLPPIQGTPPTEAPPKLGAAP